jgi:hypothetical protein
MGHEFEDIDDTHMPIAFRKIARALAAVMSDESHAESIHLNLLMDDGIAGATVFVVAEEFEKQVRAAISEIIGQNPVREEEDL